MQNLWSTVFFWTAFSVVSSLLLRYFYFSKNATLVRRLRITAGIFLSGVLVLLFFPWLPEAHGGGTGWGIILQGDVPMVILVALIGFTFLTLFIPRRMFFSKIGVLSSFIATIFLFGLMIYTFPDTISLKLRDTAPIFAVLLLLANNVVGLLLWHQLQTKKK